MEIYRRLDADPTAPLSAAEEELARRIMKIARRDRQPGGGAVLRSNLLLMTSLHRTFLPAAAMLLAAGLALAGEAAFSARGKLLFQDDFSAAALAPGWAGQPGTWEIVDGAVRISERPQDKHAAVRRHALAYHDAIFEFDFRLDGARAIHLSINNKNGHVCRLIVTPKGMVLQTDKPNAKSDVKPARLASLDTAVESGTWHKAVVEVRGRKMIAQLDGKQIVAGESPLVDVDKTDLGFPVSGVSASLDNVRVYAVR
jgi:hypothetical protein